MKKIVLLMLAVISASSFADQHVNGYMRRDGTYVQPHYQTAPDRNPYNNYSTQGNANPYTGQMGTRDPVQVQQQYSPNMGGGYGNNANPYANPYGQQRRGW